MGPLQWSILVAVVVLIGIHFARQPPKEKAKMVGQLVAELFVQIFLPLIFLLALIALASKGCIWSRH